MTDTFVKCYGRRQKFWREKQNLKTDTFFGILNETNFRVLEKNLLKNLMKTKKRSSLVKFGCGVLFT